MIKFKKISYRNFLSAGNIFTTVNLDQFKNTLIIGENGAGKSSVLEAISFALYGKSMRNVNKPQLINSITGKGLLTEIEFSIGGKSYLVRRGMKPNIFEIYIDDKLLNQDSAARDYQEILETQILKLNHKSFSQIVVLSISNYVPFMKLTAAGRREVIEDLLDIQIFSVMNSLLKEKVVQNKIGLQENEYETRLVQNKIQMHRKHMAELAKNNKEIIHERKEKIKWYQEQSRLHAASIKSEEKALKVLNKKSTIAGEISKKLAKATSDGRLVTDKRKTIQASITFYETNTICPTCKQELDLEHKEHEITKKARILLAATQASEKLEKTIEKLQASLVEYEGVGDEISKACKSITESDVHILTNNRVIESLKQEIVELEKKINKTKDDSKSFKLLSEELNNSIQKKEMLIRQREIYSMASQLLKDGGIKTRIIKQYIPIMNKLINKYLAQMEFFVQFELDETFKETIKSRFRDEFTYDSFSQGEKLRIDLSLLFCWRAIAKLRNSSSSNLLFMDEILDSSLDAGGVEEFIKIINSLTSDTNTFIISHRGDSMIDKFENIIKFEKVKNFSKIIE